MIERANGQTDTAVGLAGAALVASLIKVLHNKSLLSDQDLQNIMSFAEAELKLSDAGHVQQARKIIENLNLVP